MLHEDIIVDTTLIAAPNFTKNEGGERIMSAFSDVS